jgi:hypothetical protein
METTHINVKSDGPTKAISETPSVGGKTAILICHGMGQQVKYETIDDIANVLTTQFKDKIVPGTKPSVEFIDRDGDLIPRAEIDLLDKDNKKRTVHVYEAYWAPLTEGKIGGWATLKFLFFAALEGIRRCGKKKFPRWIFGKEQNLSFDRWTITGLILAFLCIASIAILYSTLVFVVTDFIRGKFGFGSVQGSLIKTLGNDFLLFIPLPLIISFLVIVFAIFRFIRGKEKGKITTKNRSAMRLFLTGLAFITILYIILTGGIVLYHTAGNLIYDTRTSAGIVGNNSFVQCLRETRFSMIQLLNNRWLKVFGWSSSILLFFVGRWFLIQYVGDVAIYVSSNKLNGFYEVRNAIQETAYKVAAVIYSLPEYDRVIMMGHSLGSVVAYDTLNRMILEDSLGKKMLHVTHRTKALITFGSPLDKTAFIFGTQAENAPFREALAAGRQPLVVDYRFRPDAWINVWSRADWISGTLDFYDDPFSAPNSKRVENIEDPVGFVPLMAHTQYLQHDVVMKHVYNQI